VKSRFAATQSHLTRAMPAWLYIAFVRLPEGADASIIPAASTKEIA
jgi:hypothetical protein